MAYRKPIEPGDSVVVLDIAGQLVRDAEQRVMRGTVMTVSFFGTAVVSLARSGRQVATGVERLRRCPELAYVRPHQLAPEVA